MPRSTTSITSHLAASDLKTHSAVHIATRTGTYYLATTPTTDPATGIPYLTGLKSVGEIRQSILRPTDRVNVSLANEDSVRGIEVVSGVREYNNADATILKVFSHPSYGIVFKKMFRGKVSKPVVTETEVRLEVVDPLVWAGTVLGSRPMTVKCPFRFKDTRTCGYAGANTTCNKSLNSPAGCLGNANTSKFGGWFFPYVKTASAPSGAGGGGGFGTCFVGDTLITMADGSTRPIKDIKVGDRVLCFYYDEERGEDVVTTSEVENVLEHVAQEHYRYGFSHGKSVGVTPEHPIYVGKGAFRIADFLRLRNNVKTLSFGKRGLTDTTLDYAMWNVERSSVYNIHVREFNTYFANGLAVHNWKPEFEPPPSI